MRQVPRDCFVTSMAPIYSRPAQARACWRAPRSAFIDKELTPAERLRFVHLSMQYGVHRSIPVSGFPRLACRSNPILEAICARAVRCN